MLAAIAARRAASASAAAAAAAVTTTAGCASRSARASPRANSRAAASAASSAAAAASTAASGTKLIDPSLLQVTQTSTPRDMPAEKTLLFGKEFADHMLECEWSAADGWAPPRISPYHNLSLSPAASALHYAIECFEGMKAYKDAQGRARLFRPDRNAARLAASVDRLCMPAFGEAEFIECLKRLVSLDQRWIPRSDGYSLYLRPTVIGTTPWLGVGPTTNCLLFTISSPVGPYYPSGFKPVQIFATGSNVRAWPRGTGDSKLGGNYGPTIKPQVEAAARGYSQVLWLFGEDDQCTEVGTMNLFMFWVNADGERELVTPPLDGTILPGVTRDSVLALAREWGEFAVAERAFTMADVVAAAGDGRLLEMFGAGTAVIVCPINKVGYKGVDYDVPLDKDDASAGVGPLTKRMYTAITDIQYGRVEHPWSVLVD